MSSGPASTVPQALLVAMDFSPSARRALDLAFAWCPAGEITVLHVVDTEFAGRVASTALASAADVVAKLRARADEEFAWLQQEKSGSKFGPMVVEGSPFVEIVKIANDLEVDMIAMGMHTAASRLDTILFGSTAEKVLRTSRCPVLCVP